jgi:tRNA-dihydrouridine synthase B
MNPAVFVKTLREKKLLLPPLSGYTDYPFRVILAGFHPPFIMTEMANARAIIQGNRRTTQILRIAQGNQFNGVQLVGSTPEYMGKAARMVEALGFDYIDINMGCTARKVTCRGEGLSLMKQEKLASDIVASVVSSVDVPVTCKLRLGASKTSLNVASLSQRLADAGAVAVTIHGRSGEKKFGVPVDLAVIKEVVDALPIPVIANGGIYTGRDAQHVLKVTGVAAVMPGRGLIGNPWIIPEILAMWSDSSFSPPTLQEKKDVCSKHLDLLVDFYGERRGVLKMRNILPHYFSSCVHVKNLKFDVQRMTTVKEISLLREHIQNRDAQVVYGA